MEGRELVARSGDSCASRNDEEDSAEMHEDADFTDLPVHFQPMEADGNAHRGPSRTPISDFGVEKSHRSLMDSGSQYLDTRIGLTSNYTSPPPSDYSSHPPVTFASSSSSNYASPPPSNYTSPPPANTMDIRYNPLNRPSVYPAPGETVGDSLAYGSSYHGMAHDGVASNSGMYGTSSRDSHFNTSENSAVAGSSGKSSSGDTYTDANPATDGPTGSGSEMGLYGRSGNRLCSAGVNTVEAGFGLNGQQSDKQYHPCPHCSKLFTRRDHMKRHMKIHIRGDPVKCVECQTWFPSKMDLTHHLLDAHLVLVFECNACSKGFFEAKYLTEHLKNKHDMIDGPDGRLIRSPTSKLPPSPHALQLPFRCGICSLSFINESACNKHMISHSKRVNSPVSSVPLASSHLTEVRDTSLSQLWAQTPLSQDDRETRETNLALQAFSPGHHSTSEKGNPYFGNGMGMPAFPQNECLSPPGQMVKSEPGDSSRNSHHGKEGREEDFNDVNGHFANLLLKGAFPQADMALRMMQCTGSDSLMCGVCGKTFSRSQELKVHLRKHSGHHRFVCLECGACFASSSNLVRHQRTHSGEKPFKCSLCSAAFTHKGALINHERIHTGERPYVCDLCDAAFARVDALTRHKRTHKENRIKQEEDVSTDDGFGMNT